MTETVIETARRRTTAKQRRATTRGATLARSLGDGHVEVSHAEFRRTLAAWGWEPVEGSKSPAKHRWPKTDTTIPVPTGTTKVPRPVIERAADAMGIPLRHLLAGPHPGNPHQHLAPVKEANMKTARGNGIDRPAPPLTQPLLDSESAQALMRAVEQSDELTVTDLELFLLAQQRVNEMSPKERCWYDSLRQRLIDEDLYSPDDDPAPVPVAEEEQEAADDPSLTPPVRPSTGVPAAEPEQGFDKAEHARRAAAAYRAAAEARRADAAVPGTAATIEAILDRSPMTKGSGRRTLLDVLHIAGGAIDSPDGNATAVLQEFAASIGYAVERVSLRGLLRGMVEDSQVARHINGNRTYWIGLVDPVGGKPVPECPYTDGIRSAEATPAAVPAPDPLTDPAPQPVATPEEPQMAASDQTPVTPASGTTLTVTFVDADGKVFLATEDGRLVKADALVYA